jgi:hypothetical protein
MKNIKNFDQFSIYESSSAGSREHTYEIPFAYTSNDPKFGYSSKSFVDDLEALFVEKPSLKKEIIEFLVQNTGISRLQDLALKPFSYVKDIIPEIERIIAAGEYEPELIMPGGALLFIRNKVMSNGRSADFYINKKGTKIEVVTEDINGEEKVYFYDSNSFPYERFEFTPEEKEELQSIIKAKGA